MQLLVDEHSDVCNFALRFGCIRARLNRLTHVLGEESVELLRFLNLKCPVGLNIQELTC